MSFYEGCFNLKKHMQNSKVTSLANRVVDKNVLFQWKKNRMLKEENKGIVNLYINKLCINKTKSFRTVRQNWNYKCNKVFYEAFN